MPCKPEEIVRQAARRRNYVMDGNPDCLAGLLSAGSNQFSETLKEWNTILQHSSLGCGQPSNENESKDGDAPRVSRPADGRRRKLA